MKQVTSIAAMLGLLFLCAACGGETRNRATATPSETLAATASVPTLAPTLTSAAPTLQSTQSIALTTTVPPATTVTPTAVLSNTVAPADSGLPAAIASLLPNANPVHGGELALQNGCSACHSLDEGVKVVGPSWYNLGNHAATRVSGESAPLYLYNSIILPNHYVLEGFLPNLMPQTYADQLSEQDIADLITYLLTLRAN